MDAILNTWPLGLIGLLSLAGLMGACELGARLGSRSADDPHRDAAHGYILSGVFGLLALLIGFTFGMALDRFETRRALVVSEANAIGTAEMRVQLLEAPAGPALSSLLRDYARTRLLYGQADAAQKPQLAVQSEVLRERLQADTLAGVAPIRTTPLAALVVSAINETIDIGAEREAAHAARLPATVAVVLFVYAVVAAGVLGFALSGSSRSHRSVSALMFLLLTLALTLILDLDRPRGGSIQVSQAPMEGLVASFRPQVTLASPPSPATPVSPAAGAPSRP
jgi:hypothetical protein